ncbi:GvpL/GvpF family gas vesicle protein [Candidatus Poribacteria bacterium]|nr:GvpL/GvpF family gas vesicle protein [Candidatus Poribacteria bacterium]
MGNKQNRVLVGRGGSVAHTTAQAETSRLIYLYAIIGGADACQGYDLAGIDGRVVQCISIGPVAAVVSETPGGKMRPERRHLAAHHQVLKRLMEKSTPLPMAFGIIADGPGDIERILSLNREVLVEQLERVGGKVEMSVRVLWDVPNIFEFFVNVHPELKALRDRFFRGGHEPSHDDKIGLGRLFDRLMNEDRATHTDCVVNLLSSRCCEIKENKPRTECEVMNLACLIRRDAQKDFEDGIFETAKLFDNNYSFDFGGPFPPHSFAEINLQM